jgi:hypothetical protein
MALKVTKSSGRKKFEAMKDGLKQARIAQIIDIGTRQRTDQNGVPRVFPDGNPMMVNEVIFTFEFPEETIEIDGESKPRWVSKRFGLSSSQRSNLYKLCEAALGKFTENVLDLAGKQVTVNVGTTSGGNNNIKDILPAMGEVGELSKEFLSFDLSDPDIEVFNSFPDWIKEEIKSSVDCPDSLYLDNNNNNNNNNNTENPFD